MYLEDDLLPDDEIEDTVEELYSDGNVWDALDLILDTTRNQRELNND